MMLFPFQGFVLTKASLSASAAADEDLAASERASAQRLENTSQLMGIKSLILL